MQIVTSFRQKYMFVLRASLYKRPKGLQPKRFMGEQITENFVRSIRSGTTAWRQLIGSHSSYRGWRSSHPHAAIELYITRALLSGDIQVYLLPDIAALSATKKQRQAHQANGKRIQFVPASYLLDNQAAQVQEIQTAEQADDVIAGCNFLPNQYSDLAKALHLSNEPQALQKALQSGQVAIIKDDEPGKPEAQEIMEELAEAATGWLSHDSGSSSKNRQSVQVEKEEPTCSLDSMIVSCSHADSGARSFRLNVIDSEPNLNGRKRALQVIAPGSTSRKSEYIGTRFSGTCIQGNAECPSITINGPDLSKTIPMSKSPYTFKASHKKANLDEIGFFGFLKNYFLPAIDGLEHATYIIESTGCDSKKHQAEVHAFPTLKWGGRGKSWLHARQRRQ